MNPNWLDDIKNLTLPPLSTGAHASPAYGLCAMEMVAYIERLPHSDGPACTCPVLAAFTRTLNDYMPDDHRQSLMPVLPMLVGTVDPTSEGARSKLLQLRSAEVCRSLARLANLDNPFDNLRLTLLTRTLDKAVGCPCPVEAAGHSAAAIAYVAHFNHRIGWPLALQALKDAIALGPSTGWTGDASARARELVTEVSSA